MLDSLEEEKLSITKCAKKFELDRRLVSRWKQQKAIIDEARLKRLRYKVEKNEKRCHFEALEKN